MKDLAQAIKEIESVSLYCFKDSNHADYSILLLYFSPDDIHRFVGFSQHVHKENKEKKVVAHIGKFYVDPTKQDLFIDNPEHSVEVPDKMYKSYYRSSKKVSALDREAWSIISPLSS